MIERTILVSFASFNTYKILRRTPFWLSYDVLEHYEGRLWVDSCSILNGRDRSGADTHDGRFLKRKMKQVMHHGQIGLRKDKQIIACVFDLAGLTDDLGNDYETTYDFWAKLSHQSSEISP